MFILKSSLILYFNDVGPTGDNTGHKGTRLRVRER